MQKKIQVSCRGAGAMPLEKFKEFQGDLKTLSKEKFEQGRRSILRYGISDPIRIWKGHNEILDGHQRVVILKHLIDKEGYEISGGMIPYDEIEAETRKEAGEKLLSIFNSRYGRISDSGLSDFVKINEIDLSGMMNDLNLELLDVSLCKNVSSGSEFVEINQTLAPLKKSLVGKSGGGDDAYIEQPEPKVEKFPITFILEKDEYDQWVSVKKKLKVLGDKTAFLKLIGGDEDVD